MILENWLITSAFDIKAPYCSPLKEKIKCDCLIIGGGFTGLHAALRLIDTGKDVVILEKRMLGGSSSGRSAGFITPESEEDLDKLIKKYGKERAEIIYTIPQNGVKIITEIVKKYKFNCDFRKQDSIYLSIKNKHNKQIMEEMETRKDMKMPYELLDEKGLKKVHPGRGYTIGLKYPGSYGINSFAYTQEMKNVLLKKGVRIFEDSEAEKIEGNTVKTHLGSVTADNIVICMDKMKKEFNEEISKNFYHVQTYVAVSEPLNDEEMKTLFPNGELMCWDTRWNYMHYRPVKGNRILIGGSSNLTLYAPKYYNSPATINSFIKELKWRFPTIKDIHFTHYWSGLIDVTKDLTPIADYDKNNKSIQYAMGCAGLPWAAFCGDYLARRIINPKGTKDLSEFLGMHRKFFLSHRFQKFFGKIITFSLSHLRELYR